MGEKDRCRMIFKVVSNFDDFACMEKELKKFNFMFLSGAMYISDPEQTSEKRMLAKLRKIFPADSYIVRMDEIKLKLENYKVIEWCRNQFVAADEIKFEKENQKKLNQIMEILDNVEKELFDGVEIKDNEEVR